MTNMLPRHGGLIQIVNTYKYSERGSTSMINDVAIAQEWRY